MKNSKTERLTYTKQAQEIVTKMSLAEKVLLMSGRLDMEQMMQDFIASNEKRHYNWFPYPAGGNDRLDVPEMKFCDGPRGVVCEQSTCFPVAMGRGATYDPDLEERIGEAIAKEIRAYGGNLFGGVCINLPYNPGWGRSQEVYGEDSFHLGQMGAAMVRGIQKHNVIACIKHYAFNSMENARFKVSVDADPRTEQEVYLSHFKDCIDAGAASVMSAYNLYKGTHCGHHDYLLNQVLKKDWDFDGFVISDFVWGIKDTADAANHGLDIEMPATMHYGDKLVQAVQDGRVDEKSVNEAALRIVRTLLAFTNAEDPMTYSRSLIACPEHIGLAREVAEKSLTLIQNNHQVLPFAKDKVKKVALIGKLGDVKNIGDHGSSRVFPPYVVTPLEGLAKLLPDCEVMFYGGDDLEHAADLARSADAVVLFAGYDHDDEGEFVSDSGIEVGGDRKASLGLHEDDIQCIKIIGSVNPNTALVMIGGNMIMIEDWKNNVPAILMAYYPGMEGGTAIAKALFGDINPGGKLPYVTPMKETDLPQVDWEATSIKYDYYHGYRRLEKNKVKPCLPYGFGLSYTTFAVTDPEFSVEQNQIIATCQVRNTGNRPGDEVVQFYVGFANSMIDRPVKALRGFQRISLVPGETKSVRITCPLEKLKWYDSFANSWELESMVYEAYIGNSSDPRDLLTGSFEIR